MCKQENLSGKQLEKNPNQPPASTGEKEADELEIFLSDLTPEAQKKILLFLEIETAEESNLDVFPLFVLPKPEQ
jgi:hypothetical protein